MRSKSSRQNVVRWCVLVVLSLLAVSCAGSTIVETEPGASPDSGVTGPGDGKGTAPELGAVRLEDLPVAVDGQGRGPHSGVQLTGASPFVNAMLGPKVSVRGSTMLYTRTTDLVDMSWQTQSETDLREEIVSSPGPDDYIIKPEVVLLTPSSEQILDVGFAGALRADGSVAYGSLVDKQGINMFEAPRADLVVTSRDGTGGEVWATDGVWLPVLWIQDRLLAYDLADEPNENNVLYVFEGPGKRTQLPGSLASNLADQKIVLTTYDAESGVGQISTFDLHTMATIDSIEVSTYLPQVFGARSQSEVFYTASNGLLLTVRILSSGKIESESLTMIQVDGKEPFSQDMARAIDFITPHPDGKTALLISYNQVADDPNGEIYQCSSSECVQLGEVNALSDFSFLGEIPS